MKHQIKKNRLKIFIALSLMITCLFGVMFATNTFAYNVRDYLGYTSTLENITNSSFNNISIKEFENNETSKEYLEFNINSNSTWNNFIFNVDVEETKYMKNYCIILNYDIGYYNSTTGLYTSYISSSNYCQFNIHSNRDYQSPNAYLLNTYSSDNNFNYKFRTQMWQFTSSGANNNETFNDNTNFTFGLRTSNASAVPILRIYNIDFINVDEITLSIYYSSLQEQYNQLLEDYNDLENNYDTLNDNYTQLENDYNDINSQYQDVIDVASNGIWNYIDTLDWYYGSGNFVSLSLDDLKTLGAINGNMLDFGIIRDTYSNSSYYYRFNLYFNSSFPLNVNLINMYVEMSDILIYDTIFEQNTTPIAFSFKLGHIENNYIANGVQPIILEFTKSSILPYDNFVNRLYLDNQNTNFDFPNYLDYYNAFVELNTYSNYFTFNSNDTLKLYSYNSQYQIGYQQGLNESNNISKNYYEGIINEKNEEINSLTDDIDVLERANRILQSQVATNDTYNMNNLIWTIAETPFESFKHIWNVNFFGVNIADFVLGFITTFIALFVIKKLFF